MICAEKFSEFENSIPQTTENDTEFFEEEESGDKTNPDPDDIATFFEEDDSDSTEKTNINETQMLQTRIASIDEINYIKDQVKRRQQKRFLVRAAVFASIAFAIVLSAESCGILISETEAFLNAPSRISETDCGSSNAPAFAAGYKIRLPPFLL